MTTNKHHTVVVRILPNDRFKDQLGIVGSVYDGDYNLIDVYKCFCVDELLKSNDEIRKDGFMTEKIPKYFESFKFQEKHHHWTWLGTREERTDKNNGNVYWLFFFKETQKLSIEI